MLTGINPKLPMRNKEATKDFYLNKLGFQIFGNVDYAEYLMIEKDGLQMHFVGFKDLDNVNQANSKSINSRIFNSSSESTTTQ